MLGGSNGSGPIGWESDCLMRDSKSFLGKRVCPKGNPLCSACKESSWEGARAFIIHYADFH